MGEPVVGVMHELAAEPVLAQPATEPLVLDGVEVVQASWELAGARGEQLLPVGLIPTNPILLTVVGVRVPDTPLGPATWAQVRLSCRSGARARALALPSVVDAADESAARLAAQWGIGGRRGTVRMHRGYDEVRLTTDGLDISLLDPAPIGVHDVQYVVGLHPVRRDGERRLAQVELDVTPQRLERGRPILHGFDGTMWGDGRLRPAHPVAGTIAVGSLTLPALRFLLDPDRPAHQATEVIA
jgi:hypothetical protein